MIIYLLDTFPSLTETFILREILELKRQGMPLQIIAFKRDSGEITHAEAQGLEANVIYVPTLLNLANLPGTIAYAVSHPAETAGTICSFLVDLKGGFRFAVQRAKTRVKAWLLVRRGIAADHYHAHFAYVAADLAQALARITGSSWSLSVHAWDVFTQPAAQLGKRLAGAEKIFACTQHALDKVTTRLPAYRDRAELMYHGIDPALFVPAPHTSRAILSVGRLTRKKGFDVLISACAILKERNVAVDCTIVGDGEERQALLCLVQELGLQDSIHLVGKQPLPETIRLYQQAALFVLPCRSLPSGDHDGLPNVLLEAEAMECPVITTAVGGIPEFIVHNQNGVIVDENAPAPLADAMKSLLNNLEQARQFGRRGREKVLEQFAIGETIKPLCTYFCAKNPEK